MVIINISVFFFIFFYDFKYLYRCVDLWYLGFSYVHNLY